jgi:hypothetical protein
MRCSKYLAEWPETDYFLSQNKRGRGWYCKDCNRRAVNQHQWQRLLESKGQQAILDLIAKHRRLTQEMEEWLADTLSTGPLRSKMAFFIICRNCGYQLAHWMRTCPRCGK